MIQINYYFDKIKKDILNKEMPKDKILGKEIEEAINFCIVNDIMASYLEKFRVEVFKMLNTEYSVEMEIEGILEEAHEEILRKIALNMLNKNFPVAQIKSALGLSIKEIKKN
jgi:hypothetical protein